MSATSNGLYYYRARYYHPTLGRFLQTDPVGYADNMNMYAYVGNDPINKTDPSGLSYCLRCDPNSTIIKSGHNNAMALDPKVESNPNNNSARKAVAANGATQDVLPRDDGKYVIVVYPKKTATHVDERHSPSGSAQDRFTQTLGHEKGAKMASRGVEAAMKTGGVKPEGLRTVYEAKLGGHFTSVGPQGQDFVRVVTQPLDTIDDPVMKASVAAQLNDPVLAATIASFIVSNPNIAVEIEVVMTQYPINEKNRVTKDD